MPLPLADGIAHGGDLCMAICNDCQMRYLAVPFNIGDRCCPKCGSVDLAKLASTEESRKWFLSGKAAGQQKQKKAALARGGQGR